MKMKMKMKRESWEGTVRRKLIRLCILRIYHANPHRYYINTLNKRQFSSLDYFINKSKCIKKN